MPLTVTIKQVIWWKNGDLIQLKVIDLSLG